METRTLWWNVKDLPFYKEIFYGFFIISIVIFFYGFYLKINRWSKGKPLNNYKNYPSRFQNMFSRIFLHKGWGKEKLPILAHGLVFYGFFALWIGTDILTVQERMPYYFFEGLFYKTYSFIMDIFGLLLLCGCLMFGYIRFVKKPKRLDNFQNHAFQLVFLELFVIIGFLIEGLRQSITNQIEFYTPIGALLGTGFQMLDIETQKLLHCILWWTHSFQTFLFVALIPFTKFSHIFISPANIFFKDTEKKGSLSTPFNLVEIMQMENPPDSLDEGVKNLEDFTWKDLMDLDACTSCGKCQDLCPASNSEKPLSPKFLILDLRQKMYGKPTYAHTYKPNTNSHSTDLISPETLWSCTTCNACVEACPVGINQMSKIIDLRRALIPENKAPNNLINTLKNIRTKFNPWGQPQDEREKWTEDLNVPMIDNTQDFEYLYWVGCAGAYDSRNQNVARSMVNILKKADVKFAVLGKKEKCTGDTARRAGDEGLFQELAIENIETFKNYNVKKIVTHCPHCFNTLKNEYPEFGLNDVEIFHHSDIIWDLIKNGKLSLTKEIKEQITYHDSCYLGRHNGKYSSPRAILDSIPGAKYTEIENSKERGTCCGGGGAQLWYEAPGKQINVMRLDEIKESQSSIVATACPFCTIMLETAKTLDSSDNTPKIKDISELVSENLV